jgi:hypothetical protein
MGNKYAQAGNIFSILAFQFPCRDSLYLPKPQQKFNSFPSTNTSKHSISTFECVQFSYQIVCKTFFEWFDRSIDSNNTIYHPIHIQPNYYLLVVQKITLLSNLIEFVFEDCGKGPATASKIFSS